MKAIKMSRGLLMPVRVRMINLKYFAIFRCWRGFGQFWRIDRKRTGYGQWLRGVETPLVLPRYTILAPYGDNRTLERACDGRMIRGGSGDLKGDPVRAEIEKGKGCQGEMNRARQGELLMRACTVRVLFEQKHPSTSYLHSSQLCPRLDGLSSL